MTVADLAPENTDLTASKISQLLTAEGLEHGRLRRVGNWGNHAYADHDRVFVKINRREEPAAVASLAREPLAAVWAAVAGIATVVPLLEAPLWLGEGPRARIATVWPYLSPVAVAATPDALAALVEAAAVITAAPAPDWAPRVDGRDVLTRGTFRLRNLRVQDPAANPAGRAANQLLLDPLARAFAQSEAALTRLVPATVQVSTDNRRGGRGLAGQPQRLRRVPGHGGQEPGRAGSPAGVR